MNLDNVLVLGVDGYIGHALALKLLKKGYRVAGVDNSSRRKYVSEFGSDSVMPILPMHERIFQMKKYDSIYDFLRMDITTEYDLLLRLIKEFQPGTIVNLAQQPSAPFSHISRKHCMSTVNNNINGTLNCLYAIKEINPDIQLIQIGSMGEYDQSSGVDIEEGTFDFQHNGKVAKNAIYPRRAPSMYHGSKIASTYFIDLAVRSWGLNVTDIMQGVVYGNWTSEIEETGLQTRLDVDEAFGTVINRFIIQAHMGHPLTVYGKGEQQRGFLALNDSIQCLMLAIDNPIEGYRTWNQFAEPWSIVDLAEEVKSLFAHYGQYVGIEHIDTPRVENTSNCYYNAKTVKLEELGFKPTRTIEDETKYIYESLTGVDLSSFLPMMLPKIEW